MRYNKFFSRKFIICVVALVVGIGFELIWGLNSLVVRLLIGICATYNLSNVGHKAIENWRNKDGEEEKN